ncbi:MAG: hypothetical protein ACE5E4_06090 [Candidatus Binatia bacterium]
MLAVGQNTLTRIVIPIALIAVWGCGIDFSLFHASWGSPGLGLSATAGDSGADECIRLGSWSIRGGTVDVQPDYGAMARAIDDNFDVVGVLALTRKPGSNPNYDRLSEKLGEAWAALVTVSPRPNTASAGASHYAIFYRVGVVRPCQGWQELVYHADNDGSGAEEWQDHFRREPAFACFEAGFGAGSAGMDFILALYEAPRGEAGVGDIAEEASHIHDVFSSMASYRTGERDLIIAGNFNLEADAVYDLAGVEARSCGHGSTLERRGIRTLDFLDHVLVHDEAATSEMVGCARPLDLRSVSDNAAAFVRTISDHLPIVVLLCSAGDDD